MIQRIQTLWLILATIAMALTFKFKFAVGEQVDINKVKSVIGITANNQVLSLALALAFIALSIFNIVIYKNRKLQMKLAAVTVLAGLLIIWRFYDQTTALSNATYAISAVLPIFALGFTISAWRCIWQDEKTIKELNSNRLR